MKYLLSTFGIGNPFIYCDLPDHAIYPVGSSAGDAIDLDYTVLLLGTGFCIDVQAFRYILENQKRLKFLRPMANSLLRLQQEGLLDSIDVSGMIAENRDAIIEKTNFLAEDVAPWLRAVRLQWNILQKDREDFVRNFGTPDKAEINSVHFTVANAVFKRQGGFDHAKIAEISLAINSRRGRFSSDVKGYIVETTRPLIAHTVVQDLVRYKTGSLILDWDDGLPFYSNLYKARWDTNEHETKLPFAARNLFDAALPELRPRNIDAVIRFVRDNKNVASLRDDIIASLRTGQKIDGRWMSMYLAEVLRSNLARDKTMRKVRYAGSVLGLLIPGATLATEAMIEAGKIGAEEIVEHRISANHHRWLFALLSEEK